MRPGAVLLAASFLSAPAWPQAAEDTPRVAGSEVPAPKRTKFVSPQYPADAQARGLRGIVIIELVIDTAGKVASATVTRSVPPFDDAALVAARQWEYEVTRVDGKPVPVRLSVPITFTMPVPRVSKQEGIPELIQGVNPVFPAGTEQPGSVVAELTLEPSGQIAEIQFMTEESVYEKALMDALRTWRFAAGGSGTIAFRLEAEFVPGKPGKVDLRLTGLRQSETMVASPPEPAPSPAVAENAPAAAPTPGPTPAAAPTPAPTPAAPPTPAATPAAPPTRPAPSSPAPEPGPVGTASNSAPPAAPPAGASGAPSGQLIPPSGPPIETLGPVSPPAAAALPTPPPMPPVSAVRDVTLEMGVPDLTRGRRPVVPPLARMASATGTVNVRFAVDAAGAASVQDVSGPELLKEAARQAVTTWVFRRTAADRLHLVASFNYGAATASATVRKED
jgi:TonB family protein